MKSPLLFLLFVTFLSIARGMPADAPFSIPASQRDAAMEAKESFERGNYLEAEKLYESILALAPDNLYVLSNLGVTRFRAGKLKLASDVLRRAVTVAPTDDFSHCVLGIVYYSQAEYDEAVNKLTKALAINPKNATAHQYLGVVAAQKELDTATKLDPFTKT